MSANLPQQRGSSDLIAAAQLLRGRVRPTRLQDDIDAAEAVMRATPEQVDQLRAAAAELADTGAIAEPAAPAVVELVDQLLHRQVDEAVETLQQQAAAAIDPCTCPPGAICAGACGYCAALDPALPCPHDIMTLPAGIAVVPDAAGRSHLPVVTVDVEHPCDVLGNAFHSDGPCGPQHVTREVAWPLEVAGRSALEASTAVVDWPAVQGAALVDVANATARPGTGHLPVLDWRGRHDPRSLSYGVRDKMLAGDRLQLADVLLPTGPVLDQGGEGECVGLGVVDAANVLDQVAGNIDGQLLGRDDAHRLFLRALQLDDVPGEATGHGTSVLAGMKAGVEAGLWSRYLWSFGTRDIAATILRRRPVIVGIPWLSGMYDTGPGGRVDVAGDDIGIGHCLVIVGLRLAGPQGQPGPWFTWLNSWGTSYGDNGLGYVHHADLARLLRSQGEAAVPLPAGAS